MRLEGLQEARLAIRSNGGAVDIGKVRATQATVSTGVPGSPKPGTSSTPKFVVLYELI